MPNSTCFPRLLLLGLACIALAAPAAANSVALEAQMSTPVVLAGAPRIAYLQVGLRGLHTPSEERAPINIAIVLDRSGSMQGQKIAEAKRAAIAALQRLRRDDIVSVVTYQSTVDVVVPATKLHDRGAVHRAIQSIHASGKTALFGGVSKGARELEKFVDENRVNTLLLLSDGLANIGPSSPGELRQLGASLARQGISVTTVGLGLDYNEDLMTGLAMASDGNHYFVEDAEDLEAVFAAEFGDAASVVAQGVEIRIRCAANVRPVRVLGREARISGQSVYASMNQLFRDQTRTLLLEVEVQPDASRIADVEVDYHDLMASRSRTLRSQTGVRWTYSQAEVERKQNRDVMVEVVRQIGAEKNLAATALRDKGKVREAQVAFEKNAAYLRQNAVTLKDESLKKEAEGNRRASENVQDDADWKRERKLQQETQYKTRQSRAPSSSIKK